MCLMSAEEKGKKAYLSKVWILFGSLWKKAVEIRPQIYYLDSLCDRNFGLLATETQKLQSIHAADTPMIRTKSFL
jgi:hypothetical protein